MVPVLFFGRQLPPALCKIDRKRKTPTSMDGKSHMDGADEVSFRNRKSDPNSKRRLCSKQIKARNAKND